MNTEKLELVRGSGNVFHDLGCDNADLEQLKALLAEYSQMKLQMKCEALTTRTRRQPSY